MYLEGGGGSRSWKSGRARVSGPDGGKASSSAVAPISLIYLRIHNPIAISTLFEM